MVAQHKVRSLVLICVFAWVLSAGASTSNLVHNGSFESGSTGWTLFGQGSGVQYLLTNNAADGVTAMRAANRTNLSHHVTQSINTNLLAEGNGTYFGIQFSVFASAPLSARCTLQLTDAAGVRTIILAEQVITSQTGRWVDVRGGRAISWTDPLTNASLRFEIGQITEGIYPPAILDNIRIVRDTDHDDLTDDIDPAPNAWDANANTIPDGWENRYGLTGVVDATDSDGDGYTDREEYWTATNPTNAWSLPAQPVNSNATDNARAILKYLALLPTHSTQRVAVGQVVTDTANDYASQVVALAAQTGHWPAMLGVVYDMINGPINHAVITPHATNYWNAGGLVHIQWNPDNPWNGNFSGDTNGINFPVLFTPGTTAHSNYIAMLNEVATGLRELGQAGVTVLFRPLNECNSVQNWYQRKAQADYVKLYRWTFDFLVNSQALNHVLWVYDALTMPHTSLPVTYYYPGDDVVDIFGINMYDDTWTPPYDVDRLSRDYPKPLAFPEGGPLTILGGTFTNTTYIRGMSNNFPRLSYFNIYNSFPFGGSNKFYGLVDNIDAAGLFNHPWVVTREELAWRTCLGPFGSWQLLHFTTNANMSSQAGDYADPDMDGLMNLFEYGQDSDPLFFSGSTLDPQSPDLHFVRNTAATDLAWVVEGTSDLIATNWDVIASKTGSSSWLVQPGITVSENINGEVAVAEAESFTSRFWRLHLSHQAK
jgi:mannan endo-1,4-beta-mannosidase